MALTLTADRNTAISLEEYVDHVTREVDLNDLESILASANVFAGLLKNRTLATDALNRELTNWREFQTGNNYTAQTFMLATGPHFIVRANIWTAPSQHGEIDDAERQNFYYEVAHDHNFTFMTGGYLGPGYRTTLWEYDQSRVAGLPGERVDLRYIEETTLPEGKIMVYRKGVDVHSQGPAADFSVSLNLLAITEDTVLDNSNQYIFDTTSATVKESISSSAGRVMLSNLARYVGNDRTCSLLEDLLTKHPDERVRAASGHSLCELCPSSMSHIVRKMADDPHDYVRGIAALVEAGQQILAESYASLV